jgi:hypothetical protein
MCLSLSEQLFQRNAFTCIHQVVKERAKGIVFVPRFGRQFLPVKLSMLGDAVSFNLSEAG